MEEDITDFSESTHDWTLSDDNGSKDYTRKITDETTIDEDNTTTYTTTGSNESLTINNDKTIDRKRNETDGQFDSNRVGNSTLIGKTVSTAFYESSHTLSDSGEIIDGKLTSNSEVTTDSWEEGFSASLPLPSSPSPDTYVESEKAFINLLHVTSKTDEKGTYRDFLGFRLSFGTYTDEFSSNSKTVSVVTTNTEDHASNGEIDYEEEYDVTLNSNSHDRKVKGAYSPIGGTEEVEKDHRKTNSLHSESSDTSANHFNGYSTWINADRTTRTSKDVSLDKASGTTNVRDTTVSYMPFWDSTETSSSDDTTDLYENTAPPKKPGEVNTGGNGGGVFAFDASGAGGGSTFSPEAFDPDNHTLFQVMDVAEKNRAIPDDPDQSVVGAFFGRLGFEVADTLADSIPFVGQAKGLGELYRGKNALGEDIGVMGRIGGAANLIPGGKKITQAAGAVGSGIKKIFGALTGVGKKADNAGKAFQAGRKMAKAVDAPKGLLDAPAKFRGISNGALNKTINAEQHVLLRKLFRNKPATGLTRESLEAAAEISRRALLNNVTSAAQRLEHQGRLKQIADALENL